MPSGPGVIAEDLIAAIAPTVPPTPVATFLLTGETQASAIIAQQQRCRVNTIQICDRVTADCLRELRRWLPGIALVQVVHVTGEESWRKRWRWRTRWMPSCSIQAIRSWR